MLVSLTKEVNENFFVEEHQYGGYDVKCKRSFAIVSEVENNSYTGELYFQSFIELTAGLYKYKRVSL